MKNEEKTLRAYTDYMRNFENIMNREERLKYIELQYEGIKIAKKCYNDNTYMEWKNKYDGNIPYPIIAQYIIDKLSINEYDRIEFSVIRKTFLDQLQHLIEQNTNYQTNRSLEIPYCILKIE